MASFTTPTQSSTLGKGDYFCKNDRSYKIVDKFESKTGKHGGKKIHFVGIDIFTDKKCEELIMSTQNIDAPTVTKHDYQLLDIEEDGTVSYLDDDQNSLSDLFLPNLCPSDLELATRIKEAYQNGDELYITVLSAMGINAIKGFTVQK